MIRFWFFTTRGFPNTFLSLHISVSSSIWPLAKITLHCYVCIHVCDVQTLVICGPVLRDTATFLGTVGLCWAPVLFSVVRFVEEDKINTINILQLNLKQVLERRREGDEYRSRGTMMKQADGGNALDQENEVEWRLLRWTCPPCWCLTLFGQKIPTDKQAQAHTLGKPRSVNILF